MLDEFTCKNIDMIVERVLKEALLNQPPIHIENLLSHLEIDRDFYNLEDPGLIRRIQHRIKIYGHRYGHGLIKVAKKVRLSALWLPDREQILVDSSLPAPKQKWASFHDVTHSLLPWQKIYFLGDTAETLDPDIQMRLEAEAHYGASALMFGGKMFTKEALDTDPQWSSIITLSKRYEGSYPTILRRYVHFSHDLPMVLVVSTPRWMKISHDQVSPLRHFVRSKRFGKEFGNITAVELLEEINDNTIRRRGGPVGDFTLPLSDLNGTSHEFRAESFFNQHYLLTLIVYQKPFITNRVIMPNIRFR